MLETPHTIVAAAIAVKTGNPFVAIPLAFLSHFILDETPHWNPHLTTKEGEVRKIDPKGFKIVFADSLIALVSGTSIAFTFFPDINKIILILICCLTAVLPDLVEAPYIFLSYKKRWLKKWLFFQKKHQFNTNIVWGLTTQVLTIIAAVWWMIQN